MMNKMCELEEKKPKKKAMENITANLPYFYDAILHKLEEDGAIPSRSEAVRTAVSQFLIKEKKRNKLLGEYIA
jgi:Arc/MetJ-type ribon-helix-helix transcriptional regulator